MKKQWIVSLVLFSFFFYSVSATLVPLWSYQVAKPLSFMTGTPDEILIASNALCHYENEPSGGTYEICDGNASLIYLKNGKLQWRWDELGDFAISADLSSDFILAGVQNKSEGIVYLFGKNGSLIWKKEIPWISTAILTRKGVLVGSSQGLFTFDYSGRLLWNKKLGDYFIVSDDKEWILSRNSTNKIICLINGGKCTWTKKVHNIVGMFISSHGDLILVASSKVRYGIGRNVTLAAFDRRGDFLWNESFRDLKNVVISKKEDYIGVITLHSFYLISPNGTLLWKIDTRGISAASIYSNLTAVGTYNGKVYLFSINGKNIGNVRVDGGVKAIILSDKYLTVASDKGVYIFQLQLKTPRTASTTNKTLTSPVTQNKWKIWGVSLSGPVLILILIAYEHMCRRAEK